MGGAVRDALLGRPCHDFDLEIHGCSPKEFDALMRALGAKGVGKSFFVYKYKDIDIALPRTEKKIATGHRGFTVDLARGTKQASMRRDFT
ncbi:MAG: CCA tRNA nucleotidyltransferase, partial [Campylobacterota bacterium]